MPQRTTPRSSKPRGVRFFARCLGALTVPRSLALTVLWLVSASGVVCANEVRIGGTGAALASLQLMADAYAKSHPATQITILRSLGSTGGIKAVLAGTLPIGVSARPLTHAETRQGARQVELGRTPFVFAAAASNTVHGLTLAELVDIYAGKTEHWPDGKKVRLVLRPVGDSDSELAKNISPEMRQALMAAEQRKGMPFAVSDQDAADSLERIPGAIGITTLAQIVSERRKLKALRLNGVEPSVKNLDEGSYLLYKRLYLVTSSQTPPPAQEFVAFVRSAAGRAILTRLGYSFQ